MIDSAPDINGALNAALEAAGCPSVDEQLTRNWVGSGSRALLERALRHSRADALIADELLMARLLTTFIDYYSAHIADNSHPYDGVADALDALHARGARLAIVTNKLEASVAAAARGLGLRDYFDALIGGDTLPQRKPNAEPALLRVPDARLHTQRRAVRRRLDHRRRDRQGRGMSRRLSTRRIQPRHEG